MATDIGCSVHLLHAYTVPVSFGDVPLPVIPVDDILNITTERVNASIKELIQQYPGIEISSEITYGDFGDLLEDSLPGSNTMLAIIGNDEEIGSNTWIGSNATTLLRDAPIPVLAVPQSATYSKPYHICLACDSKSINEGHNVDILFKLQTTNGIQLTVLHLLLPDEIPVIFEESALGKQLLDLDTTYVEMSTSTEIDQAITDYALAHGIDWLAIIPHHYGFWEGLFHRSHTERMLQLAHLPVLALH